MGGQRVTVTTLGSCHLPTQVDFDQKLQTGLSFGSRSRQVRKREDLPTATSVEFRRAKLQTTEEVQDFEKDPGVAKPEIVNILPKSEHARTRPSQL